MSLFIKIISLYNHIHFLAILYPTSLANLVVEGELGIVTRLYWLVLQLVQLTSIPAWISNYIHFKMWDEITYPFPNFNCAAIELWEWLSNFIPHFTGHVISVLKADVSHIKNTCM